MATLLSSDESINSGAIIYFGVVCAGNYNVTKRKKKTSIKNKNFKFDYRL